MKLRLANNPRTLTRTLFFKRHAPNDMKKGDLIAEWWIITDLEHGLTALSPAHSGNESPFFDTVGPV